MSQHGDGDLQTKSQSQQPGRLSIVATMDDNGFARLAIENPDGSFSTFEASSTCPQTPSENRRSQFFFRETSSDTFPRASSFLYFNDTDDDDDDDDIPPPPPPPPPMANQASPTASTFDKQAINELLAAAAQKQRANPSISLSPDVPSSSIPSIASSEQSTDDIPLPPPRPKTQPQLHPRPEQSTAPQSNLDLTCDNGSDDVPSPPPRPVDKPLKPEYIDDLPPDYILPPAPPPPTDVSSLPSARPEPPAHISNSRPPPSSSSPTPSGPAAGIAAASNTTGGGGVFGTRFGTRSGSSKMASIMKGLKKEQKNDDSGAPAIPPRPASSTTTPPTNTITLQRASTPPPPASPKLPQQSPSELHPDDPNYLPPVPPVPPLPADEAVTVKTIRRPPPVKKDRSGYESTIEVHTTTITSGGTTVIQKQTLSGKFSTYTPSDASSIPSPPPSINHTNMIPSDATVSSNDSTPPPPPPQTPRPDFNSATGLPVVPPVPELPPDMDILPPPPPPPPPSSTPSSPIASSPLAKTPTPPAAPPLAPGTLQPTQSFKIGDTSSFFKRPISAAGAPNSPSVMNSPSLPNPGLSIMPEVTDINSSEHIRLLTPKPLADLSSIGKLHVHDAPTRTNVHEVRRVAHFSFDQETGAFVDVPPEWKMELSKKFGLPLPLCCTQVVEGYTGRIPHILVTMKRLLLEKDGLSQVGIFRLAPDGTDAQHTRNAMDNGTFVDCDDPNILAHLLKVWFRELPRLILDYIKNPQVIFTADTIEQVGHVITTYFQDPYLSVFLWLLDLCCDVVAHQEVNKMGYINMAIVFSPNLFQPPPMDQGVDAMRICKLYTNFVEKAITWRDREKNRPKGY